MEINGIKMNGEILSDFNALGGGRVYKHIISDSESNDRRIIIWSTDSESFVGKKLVNVLIEGQYSLMNYPGKNSSYEYISKFDDKIWSSGNYTFSSSIEVTKDKVTEVLYPFM